MSLFLVHKVRKNDASYGYRYMITNCYQIWPDKIKQISTAESGNLLKRS